MGITNNVDTTRSQSFTYDHLNRILTAETTSTYATSPAHCWGESYTYDQWGNLTAIGVASTSYNSCTQESLSVTALSNNQLSSTGYSYDASGNMLTDGRNTYTWNSEDQLKTAAGESAEFAGVILLVLLAEWDAYVVHPSGDWVAFIDNDDHITVTARSAELGKDLKASLDTWGP